MNFSKRKFLSSIILILFVVTTLLFIKPAEINGEDKMNLQKGTITLPAPQIKGKISLEEVLNKRRSVREYKNDALLLNEISQLLWSVQGITEKNWGLRTAPSAGALYPLEVYVVVGNVRNLEAGVYKYIPETHSLTKVIDGDQRKALYNSALQQESIIKAAADFVIAAVYERTSRKYGNRAERYVHFEVGHAAQNLLLQATALNLGAVPIGAFYDEKVKAVLKLPENEQPLYIIPVGR
jgi:SagB-type dehydrogenase family enzyme